MENQVDELSLDIKVDVKKQDVSVVNSLASAIERLNKAVSSVSALDKYLSKMGNLSKAMSKVSNATATSNALGGTKLKKQEVETQQTSGKLPTIQGTDELNDELQKTIKSSNMASKALYGVANAAKETEKESSKASFGSKLLKSVGRITLYRTIRAGLKMVTQAMKEGIQNYAQYSESANKAISGIKNSFWQIKNTLGVTLGYLLEALAPAIQAVSDAIVNIGNGLNMALAAMNNKSTYSKAIKQNEDYAKSLDKVNNKLLSFDKFESLSKGDEAADPSTMFEEASISEDWNDTATIFSTIIDAIKLIVPILEKIWKILGDILPAVLSILAPILEIVDELLNFLLPVIETIMDIIGPIIEQVAGGLQMIGGLLKLLNGDVEGFLESFGNGFAKMINGIVNLFIGFINMCIDGLNTILLPIDWLVKVFGGEGLQIKHIEWRMNWQPFADGGIPEVGTMFYAGEAGAEAVYNTRSGQSGVVNIDQFTAAMYNALSAYGAARGSDVRINADLVVNGNRLGQTLEKGVYEEGVRVGHFAKA